MGREFIIVGCSSCNSLLGTILVYQASDWRKKYKFNGKSSLERIGDHIILQEDELAQSTRIWYTEGLNITYVDLVTQDGQVSVEENDFG